MKNRFRYSFLSMAVLLALIARNGWASKTTGFPPVDQWVDAVVAGNAEVLKNFYSKDPPAQVEVKGATNTPDADISFWLGLKARGMNLEVVRLKQRPGAASIIFKAEVRMASGKTINVTDAQGWRQQGGQWRIVGAERTDSPQLQQPSDMNKNLYPGDADARLELKEAEEKAATQHHRVLLIFGANWCYDCHVLDVALHRPDFRAAVSGYEIVHVDIGDDGKKNSDIAKQFDVPLEKGVPALAVIESDGKPVVSQKNGEFEDARALTPEVLLAFLNKWEPERR